VRRAAQQDMVDVFFSAGMPMHALARFSEYPRVFTFFFSLDGRCRRHLFSLSCVGADFVAPSSQRSRGECWEDGASGSTLGEQRVLLQLPVGNILEEIFLSSCRKIPGTVDVLGILRGHM